VTKDVVCGMRLSAARSNYRVDHDGCAYFFCAGGCREKFLKKPTHYAAGGKDRSKSHQRS